MLVFCASRRRRMMAAAACLVVAMSSSARSAPPSSSMILQELREFQQCASVLYVAAHPDDENTQFIAYLAKELAVRTGYLSLTRGEGGQDLIGPELGDALGVIRTQELLAARRVDGGQQFFTRAKDFGFSKDYEQTLAKWDRQGVLADTVRVIREFRPDVIVTRFPPEPGGTHGHHTASTVLALEAFKAAGDPKAFREQIERDGLPPWSPRRIFWNAFRGGKGRQTFQLDLGGYLPLLGQSIGEIAALSRSNHRSQGYGSIGSRGSRLDDFLPLDGQPTGRDLFDGIDGRWRRFPDGETIEPLVHDLIARFDPMAPLASIPALLNVSKLLAHLPPDPVLDAKRAALDQIIANCAGLYVETTIPQAEAVPGETLHLRHTAIARGDVPVTWESTVLQDVNDAQAIPLHPNQSVVRDSTLTLPADQPLTQPYWLRAEGPPGMYRVDDPQLIGKPEAPSPLRIVHTFAVGDGRIRLFDEPMRVTADPAKGEIRRAVDIIPPVSLALGRSVQMFSPGAAGTVDVEVKASRANLEGTVSLPAPAGWQVSPATQPFHLAAADDHAWFTFTVTAPPQPEVASLTANATIGDKVYNAGRQEILYEHIPPQLLQSPARLKAICLDLAIKGSKVGYLPGVGDRTAAALSAMGYEVTNLSGADLTAERLHGFDAVVIGVRAFNLRPDLAAGLPALIAFTEAGGNVIEQYNTPNELKTDRLAPFDLRLSPDLPHNRVTNENAPVTLLAPDHPAFNTPNKITDADFTGWVQERGLNFPSEWDAGHFTALLACSDPGEAPLRSGLLVAKVGQGYFVYTGLSFFRQLPAGVPGAYRLFANLVSLGK